MQRKVVVQRLALVSASILVSLVVLDLVYRWIVEPEDVVPRNLGRYDSTLGWALKPNASGTSGATGSDVTYRINSKGLRDRETTYDKPAGTLRLVLLGDSRTFGYGVQIEQHFSTLLEGYFKNVEVINLGVSGYGVDQELLAFRTEGVKYHPDIVIGYVAHFGGQRHMYADRWGKPKPQFVLRDGVLTLTNVPVPSVTAGMDFPDRVDLSMRQLSPLYRDLSKAGIRLLKRIWGRATTETPTSQTSADAAAFVDRMYALAEAILKETDTEVKGAGGRFVLVTEIPRLHRDCLKLGMTSFDVSTPLANKRFALPNKLGHINEAGNGVLAWEIAQFFLRSGLIPPRIGPTACEQNRRLEEGLEVRAQAERKRSAGKHSHVWGEL